MQIGFISRTLRGRIATKAAYDHLGAIWSKETVQDELFEGDNGFWKDVDCFRNFYDHSRCGNRFQWQIFLVGAVAGDIHWSWGKTKFFFPVVSSFVISIVGTILLNLFLENKNIFILKIIYPVRMNKGTII